MVRATNNKKSYRNTALVVIFASVFTFFMMASLKIHFCGSVSGSINENYIENFETIDILKSIIIWLIFAFVLQIIVFLISKKQYDSSSNFNDDGKKIKLSYGKTFLIILCLLLLFWSPWLLAYYPGAVLSDSLSSLYQFFNKNITSNHFPVLYTIFVGGTVKLGAKIFGSNNVGVFLYTIIQGTCMAATCSRVITWILFTPIKNNYKHFNKNKIKYLLCALSFLYYSLSPFIPTYANIMWKDPIYSCAITLLVIELCEIVKSDGLKLEEMRQVRKLIFLFLIIIFFRNNGIYVVLIVMVGLLIFYFEKNNKAKNKTYLLFVCICFLYLFVVKVVYPVAGIQSDSLVESVGIPLQQIAYVENDDNGIITPEDREFLNDLLPEEEWANSYHPCLVDSIKWNENFNQEYLNLHSNQFFSLYIRIVVNNFLDSINAWILETCGYWDPFIQCDYGYIDTYVLSNNLQIEQTDIIEKYTGFSMKNVLDKCQPLISSGIFLWVFMLAFFSLHIKGFKQSIILYPVMANWLAILIATPVAFSLRYVYAFVLSLPIALAIIMNISELESNKELSTELSLSK